MPKSKSPSSRRAWIEMVRLSPIATQIMSPSSRRAWIEIFLLFYVAFFRPSPSSRRAWIEISATKVCGRLLSVALLAEGVDRNYQQDTSRSLAGIVALLAEGVDRNVLSCLVSSCTSESPSSRRAWIEIA